MCIRYLLKCTTILLVSSQTKHAKCTTERTACTIDVHASARLEILQDVQVLNDSAICRTPQWGVVYDFPHEICLRAFADNRTLINISARVSSKSDISICHVFFIDLAYRICFSMTCRPWSSSNSHRSSHAALFDIILLVHASPVINEAMCNFTLMFFF